MAITGTKAFIPGEVLTSSDVNQYLMRGVKVFSGTAVRDAAYGGAGEPVLEEGEACFLTDTDALQIYGGTALGWLPFRQAGPGQVLQVVSTTKTDVFSTTSGTMVDVTGVTVSITPSATSSKVLVILSSGTSNSGNNFCNFDILRGATILAPSPTRSLINYGGPSINSELHPFTFTNLDSPNTTSATTYKLQMSVASGTGYVNRRGLGTDVACSTTLTVMEISA
jgi:hypothetical protein